MVARTESFDHPTAASLSRLRWLLEDAQERADHGSQPSRHAALIGLDGAVEYALWLTAHTIGADIKKERPSWDELVRSVDECLDAMGRRWEKAGRAGVTQLRRARNDAQHAGLEFDNDQLASWSDAAHAYVDSLLGAAFGIGVRDLVLALSVRDPDLHSHLAKAESALAADSAEEAFTHAWVALELALWRWRGERIPRPTFGAPALPLAPSRERELYARLEDVESSLDVQTFAPDFGEYVSLSGVRRLHAETGFPPSRRDAERALRFVTGWIVRWELFELGYPGARWVAWQDAIEPPTAGDGKTPTITGVSSSVVTTGLGNPRWALRVQIANVPERGRGVWGADMRQCLTEAGPQADASMTVVAMDFHRAAGLLVLEVEPGADGPAMAEVLRRAVELAHTRYLSRRAEAAEREASRAAVEEQWAVVVSAASGGVIEVGQVTNEVRHDGEHLVAELAVHGGATPVEMMTVAGVLRSHGGPFAGTGLREGVLEAEVAPLDDAAAEGVVGAVEAAAAELSRIRKEREQSEKSHRQFVHDLHDVFGDVREGEADD
jgi:hypothetical protein